MRFLLTLLTLCVLPLSALAMEPISDIEMDNLTGQAGVNIFFEGKTELQVNVQDIAWGDDDGVTGNANAGFIVIDANSTHTINVGLNNALLTLDVATTGTALSIAGIEAVAANTTFLKVGLPQLSGIVFNANMANTYDLKLSNLSTGVGGTTKSLGQLYLDQFELNLTSISDNIYISAH